MLRHPRGPATFLLRLGLVTWTFELTNGWTELSGRGIPVLAGKAARIPSTRLVSGFGRALYSGNDRIVWRRPRCRN